MTHPELEALVFSPTKANLSVRAYNALANAGLCTLRQVRASDLTRVRNMGPRLRRFVKQRIARADAVAEADFVKVERWECRVACGAILKKEEIHTHRCGVPLGLLNQEDTDTLREWIESTDWDAAGHVEGEAANAVARLIGWPEKFAGAASQQEEPDRG